MHLQGGSESGTTADHHIRLSVNGGFVGGGDVRREAAAPARDVLVPASLLREGANELSVANVGDTGVELLVFLDRFEICYPQVSAVRAGSSRGCGERAGRWRFAGLSGLPIVLDVTGPTEGRWVTGYAMTPESVRFQAEAGHRYLVASPEGLLTPRIGRVPLSTLKAGGNQADYLVIAPRDLLEAATPLLERRRSQGLVSRAVSFEEIASEFGQGSTLGGGDQGVPLLRLSFMAASLAALRSPSRGRDVRPAAVRLDVVGVAACRRCGRRRAICGRRRTRRLAAVNGEDLLPDLAIGRLPATTREQAEALVGKLLAWEDSGQDLSGNAVLVADNPDLGGDFEADVEDIRQSFLGSRSTATLTVRALGGATRPAILGAFDDGASLMSYVGHGGTAVWSSANVLNSWDAASLRAQIRQPLLLTMNCLNGYFVAPNFDALPEALAEGGGAGGDRSILA